MGTFLFFWVNIANPPSVLYSLPFICTHSAWKKISLFHRNIMSPFQYIHGYLHHQAKHVFEGTNFKSDDVMAEGVKKIYSTQSVKYGFLRELLIHFEEVQYHSQKNNEVLSCRKEKTKRPQFMIMLARK